ncbi:MAG: sensor histidine kinase [Chlorobiaceae bacterium]
MAPAEALHWQRVTKLAVTIAAFILLVIFASFFPAHSVKAATTVTAARPVILDREPRVELSGRMERYDDPTGKLTLADILDQKHAIGFKRLKGNLNDGYSHKAVWLRFSLSRTSRFPADAWLRLYPSYLDHVTVSIQTGANPSNVTSYRKIELGDHIPVAERPVPDPDFFAPLSLPLKTPVTIYVRVEAISSLNFGASVHTPTDMILQTDTNILFQGGYLAIVIVISLLNFIYFIRIKDRLFLSFALYALAVSINYLSISGILSLILPASAHLISDYLADLGKGGGILLVSIFLLRLFASELTTFSRHYLRLMVVIGALTVLADPLGFYIEMAPVTSLGALFLFVVVSWLSYKAVKNNKPGGIVFFVAFGISNLGYFIHFLQLLGLVPLEWWSVNNIQYASLLNIVLMTFALAERLRETEKRAMAALRESELKSVELATERAATERQQRFLTMVSHEYRTPLAIIRSSLDIMELQMSDQRSQENGNELSKMKRAVHRLVEVMDVSLEKSRLSDSKEKEGTMRTLLAPFMASEVEEVRALWPKRTFIFSISLTDQTINAEQHYLTTALFNLLDNAQKYSPPDSPIDVDCNAERDEVVIRIRNESNGIMTDETEQLFKKYQRGSNSNNTNGSGLGLWLVQEIIQRHHGSVTFEKSDTHVMVTVRLPLADTGEKYTKNKTL